MKSRILFFMLALLCFGFTLPTRRVLSRPASSGGASPPTFVRKVDGVTINGSILNTLTLTNLQVDGANREITLTTISYGTNVFSVKFNTSESFTRHSITNYYDTVGFVETWKLVAPSVTTANIVVVWAGSVNAAATALLFNNVDQTTPLGAVNSALYLAGAASVNLTVTPASSTSDLVIDVFGYYAGSAVNYTPGAGQTATAASALNDGNESILVTRKAGAAGTTSMSKTWSSNTEATLVGVAVKGL